MYICTSVNINSEYFSYQHTLNKFFKRATTAPPYFNNYTWLGTLDSVETHLIVSVCKDSFTLKSAFALSLQIYLTNKKNLFSKLAGLMQKHALKSDL